MIRSEKTNAVKAIEEVYNSSNSVIITHYHGLTVGDITDLRKSLKEQGAGFKVVKNTLSKIAAKNVGMNIEDSMFAGPTAIAFSEDPISAAKGVMKFSKANDNLKIVGGIVNDKVINADEVEALSKLPSLDELRGKLIGVLQAPASNIARVINAPAGNLARVFKAFADK